MKKNPWVAAVLNFFFFGVGTLYVGRRPMLPWVLATVGGTIAQVLEIAVSPAFPPMWVHWPVLFGGLVLAKIGLAIDAYYDALGTH